MAPEEGRNVRNKLVTITLAVIFMIKILASSQLYRLPKSSNSDQNSDVKLILLFLFLFGLLIPGLYINHFLIYS